MCKSSFPSWLVLAACGAALNAVADINWYNTSTNRVLNADLSTPVMSSWNDGSMGAFAQLIYLGANGDFDAAGKTGSGASGDDQVVAVSWVGRGTFDSGFISSGSSTYTGDLAEAVYGVRIWSAPSPAFNVSNPLSPVPAGAGVYYGNSPKFFTTDSDPDVPPGAQPFNFAGNGFATTLQAIPEPAALVLLAGGLAVLFRYRRTR